MNKLILFTMLFCPLATIAQKDTAQHKWAVGVEANTIGKYFPYDNISQQIYNLSNIGTFTNKSFSIGLSGNYYIDKNLSIKVKAGFTIVNIPAYRDSRTESANMNPAGVGTYDDYFMQNSYYLNVGLQRDIRIDKSVFLFAGLSIPITMYSSYSDGYTFTQYDSNNSIIEMEKDDQKIPGGFTIGVAPFLGFKFKICKNFFVSSEISDAFIYQSLGGNTNEIHQVTTMGTTTSSNFNYIFKSVGISNSGAIISLTFLYIN